MIEPSEIIIIPLPDKIIIKIGQEVYEKPMKKSQLIMMSKWCIESALEAEK